MTFSPFQKIKRKSNFEQKFTERHDYMMEMNERKLFTAFEFSQNHIAWENQIEREMKIKNLPNCDSNEIDFLKFNLPWSKIQYMDDIYGMQ